MWLAPSNSAGETSSIGLGIGLWLTTVAAELFAAVVDEPDGSGSRKVPASLLGGSAAFSGCGLLRFQTSLKFGAVAVDQF
jgi:hypothetical protein